MQLWIHVDLKALAPSLPALLRAIDGWADQGASGVVFEWENVFPYPGFEAAVRPGAYTRADIQAIVGRCRSRGLLAVPLVQTLGHLEWFLSHGQWAGLREFPDSHDQIRACDERSWAVIRSWLTALMEAHGDCPFVHLGADEAWRLHEVDRPDCSSAREGSAAVFLRHMAPIFQQVLAAGKRPVLWADMVLRHPDRMADFPREAVFCDWLYSQTREHDAMVQVWGIGAVGAARLGDVPAAARERYEKYWRLGAQDYPRQFYQFPYTPFLRDHGFDVWVGPATLYAANSVCGPRLPAARANGREWLKAGRRFGALGALNTCWAVRGALRECTKAGHKAFLMNGQNKDLDDAQVARACCSWAGDDAAGVAEALDGLNACVDMFSLAAPTYFDSVTRTHRPVGYAARLDGARQKLAELTENDPQVADRRAALERAARAEAVLAPLAGRAEEAQAWLLTARESALRAELWLAAWNRARGGARSPRPELAGRLLQQAADVDAFMRDRYLAVDAASVRQDRYESSLALLRQL